MSVNKLARDLEGRQLTQAPLTFASRRKYTPCRRKRRLVSELARRNPDLALTERGLSSEPAPFQRFATYRSRCVSIGSSLDPAPTYFVFRFFSVVLSSFFSFFMLVSIRYSRLVRFIRSIRLIFCDPLNSLDSFDSFDSFDRFFPAADAGGQADGSRRISSGVHLQPLGRGLERDRK